MPATEMVLPQTEAVDLQGQTRNPAPQQPLTPPKRVKSPRRKWLAAAAILVIATTTLVIYHRNSGAVQYMTAPVDRGDIVAAVTATGNTNAVTTVQVGSQVSGNILALYADFNTKVKAGQLVAKIDPAIFQAKVDLANAGVTSANAAVANAKAGVAKAQSDIANAQANLAAQQANVVKAQSAVDVAKLNNDREAELLKDGIVAQQDADNTKSVYDQAVAALDAAKQQVVAAQAGIDSAKALLNVAETELASNQAQVSSAIANLKSAQLDLEHTNIIAPVSGTVISRNMDVGQTVAASFQAPTIFQIAQDLTKMQVDTNVDESDVAPIRVGQRATFTVDAYPGTTFQGQVAQIRQAPINVQNVITYDVVVTVANDDLKLFPGMTANVKIITGQSANALRVPVAALRFHPAAAAATATKTGQNKGQPRVKTPGSQTQTIYVLNQGQPKAVRVQFGLSDGNYLEVLNGLSEGQPIVAGTVSKGSAPAATQAPAAGGTQRFGF